MQLFSHTRTFTCNVSRRYMHPDNGTHVDITIYNVSRKMAHHTCFSLIEFDAALLTNNIYLAFPSEYFYLGFPLNKDIPCITSQRCVSIFSNISYFYHLYCIIRSYSNYRIHLFLSIQSKIFIYLYMTARVERTHTHIQSHFDINWINDRTRLRGIDRLREREYMENKHSNHRRCRPFEIKADIVITIIPCVVLFAGSNQTKK